MKGNINSNIRDPLLLHKQKPKSKQLCTNNFIQKTIICDSVHKYTVSNTALLQEGIHNCATSFSMPLIAVISQYFLTAVLHSIYTC